MLWREVSFLSIREVRFDVEVEESDGMGKSSEESM